MRQSVFVGLLILLGATGASARSLEAIRTRGALTLCAHPNALPFASKRDVDPGFQVEIARELAKQLKVALEQHWVVNSFQYRRADCDIIMDAIANPAALAEVGLRMSRPYQRSGVALAVRADSGAASLADLRPGQRVGVQVGSIASMTLSKRGIQTSPFVFEDEIMDALAKNEIDAAAVTPAAIGWFNQVHPDAHVRRIPAFEDDPDLNWNVAVGMLSPDEKLRQGLDAALEALLADGTLARIYAHYNVELRSPK
ncbi:substrate-binding periplasmic protein [Bradyrhizobium zhanjiangense]|uniref:ABC transporter substrate-binding protein n=1 Tax=Bradyrhizobium zhanjiangense TaxID=1325107 RepID=A0A4Q0SVK5_9BRAD|nr:transporter substrate-binding domain-containing protein [Bradyrhizobium zhanjiangense]RXH03354.1 ABC transporter substrate-binding protein [Bradyrhizobium zhanjiangense]RXH42096.1 ABC transporter substrate-binding protein [Bradyrhizobium zhanjiangense]